MTAQLVRITKRVSFDDLRRGIIAPIEVYQIQVQDWIISPAKRLAELYPTETDHGMALLAIELLFFEPHGQFLQGANTKFRSKQLFCFGFDRFRRFLKEKQMISKNVDDLPTASIYEWARCGLFHSSRLAKELLVDAVSFGRSCLAKNPRLGGWLVDPWRMLNALESYVQAYVNEVKNSRDSELARNFESTFTKLLTEPMEYFLKLNSR